jgi:hypothetical protein
MNSNGFTKRNIFIGDVQITEDLVCGDMICEEMTLTGNINLDNQDIIGVNNLETKTINGGSPIVNPATSTLDMAGNNIDNNPQLDNLQDKTQYISVVAESTETQFAGGILINGEISNPSLLRFTNDSVIDGSETDLTINVAGIGKITTDNKIETTSDLKCDNLTAITSISAPQITTLQDKTQYLTASANTSTFTGDVKVTNMTASGILNGTNLSVGNATANNSGYFFPPRPLGVNYCLTTGTSASNVLVWTFANLQSIFNLSAVPSVSSTFTGSLILGSPSYTMPAARGTNNQYIKTDGSGVCSFASFQTPSYAQIGRQLQESVGYSLTANVFRSATNLGGTMDTTFPNSANITPNSANGTLTYTGAETQVMVVELDLRARVADAKAATGLLTLNLISGASTILAYDIARVYNTTSRTYMACKIVQPVTTGTVFSFSIGYDSNLTNDLFLSSISLSIYAAGF